MKKTVVELFAGVGGFRVGLNNVTLNDEGIVKEKKSWKFVWANQWEPSNKQQHAFNCYEHRFGESKNHINKDISTIDKASIPDHTLLVGGFPCQDYSVARGLSGEKGIEGKKGVLWWEIYKILEAKQPPFVLLENVDRLIKSPSTQRGRDFGIMLRSFNDLGYAVEWRVINAAEYGYSQRRRRVFIFAYHKSTNYYNIQIKHKLHEIISSKGFFTNKFKVSNNYFSKHKPNNGSLSEYKDLVDVSDKFSENFRNSGIMIRGTFYTEQTEPKFKTPIPLEQIMEKDISNESLFLSKTQVEKFQYLKGSKKIPRVRPNGEEYFYSEGSMSFPEKLNLPGRTMLTSEGSSNRSTHVVNDLSSGKLRIISPIEAERLNGFPDNWTNTGLSKRQRYFMMGNALVCNIVTDLGTTLKSIINKEI